MPRTPLQLRKLDFVVRIFQKMWRKGFLNSRATFLSPELDEGQDLSARTESYKGIQSLISWVFKDISYIGYCQNHSGHKTLLHKILTKWLQH